MANAIKWLLGTYATIIAGAGVAPTLKALANNGQKIGNEIDNETLKDTYADFELLCQYASAPTAGSVVELYLIPDIGGSAYSDGSDSIAPPLNTYVGAFGGLRAVTSAQRLPLPGVVLPPGPFKPLVINKGGQAFSNVDDENVLSYRPYNREIQ